MTIFSGTLARVIQQVRGGLELAAVIKAIANAAAPCAASSDAAEADSSSSTPPARVVASFSAWTITPAQPVIVAMANPAASASVGFTAFAASFGAAEVAYPASPDPALLLPGTVGGPGALRE